MDSTPKITVLISTFSDLAYVDKKISEVEQQSAFNQAEFIFLETASPEKERELLAPFCAKHANCHLITTDERLNLYEAWNLGWESAKAPLICISNMDDTMHPRLLEFVIAGMEANDWDISTVLVAEQKLTNPKCNSWDIARLKKLKLQNRPGAFFAWKHDLIDRIGAFDSKFTIAGDKDFWARALHKKLSMGYLPHVLYFYSKHSQQLSKTPDFLKLKNQERSYASQKPYPHIWPKAITSGVKRIQLLAKLPFPTNKERFVSIEP